jgi:hypothetical protein
MKVSEILNILKDCGEDEELLICTSTPNGFRIASIESLERTSDPQGSEYLCVIAIDSVVDDINLN